MKVGNVGPKFNADSELKEKKTSYLGIKICKDQKERINLNYSPLRKIIQKKFNSWLMIDLSLNGRYIYF